AVLALPDEQRTAIDAARENLEPLFTDFVQANRTIERDTQQLLEKFTEELAAEVARKPFSRLKRRYRGGGDKLKAFFKALQEDFVSHLERFLPDDEEDERGEGRGPDPFRAFRVKVVVDNSKTKGAPVIFETHPTFYRMFGRIERRVEQGIYFTDHTMIRGGALMQANGGYLVCHAADLFQLPGVWENLKSTVRNREAAIEDLGETAGLLPTSGLKPEPIPIHLKLILIGSNTLYHLAYRTDDDFRKIFQIKADFDDEIRRSPESIDKYVRFIATAAKNNGCRALNRPAVAEVIEHGSRLVDSQRKLTLRFNDISNVLVEANYHAEQEGVEIIESAHIRKAIEERQIRSSLIADKMHEDMLDDQLLIASEGDAVGVINGLAVLSVGEHDFGRPFRVTARCFAGDEGIVNIEREVNMSGEIHDKGVQILAGFLGHRFANRRALALTATVTFEQSYGSVDGDSASSTWLYAILSALANVPLDQGIGVTGSVNQLGEIQPVGGVNHKIEGFFRFCQARKLDSKQGIIIPWQNVQHLMLSREVREAIGKGEFHIWPVRSIDEGMALLTQTESGVADSDGNYPKGTVMHAVAQRLHELNPDKPGRSDA
ncbi:MAG: AAA family ATPase, partial [Myxococcales bacterium]|nr:AAA family ATPase [Myxococcales bacterium]